MFEGVIERVTALAVLLPIVAGQGGNTGAQSLAVVIRGIALRELGAGTSRRVMIKEVLAALLNGVAGRAGAPAWCVLPVGRPHRPRPGDHARHGGQHGGGRSRRRRPFRFLLRAAGRDPAQSASIFLTTVTDVVGFSAFLGFAVLFMPLIG